MSAARTFLQGGKRHTARAAVTSYTLSMPDESGHEIEIKLAVAELAAIRRRLRAAGGRPGPRLHEVNVLFDTPDELLRRREMLLRIRVERSPAGSAIRAGGASRRESVNALLFPRRGEQRATITLKAPPVAGSAAGRTEEPAQNAYKIRREVEFEVSDSRQFRELLETLGYRPAFYYEKFRTIYRLPRVPKALVALDETPVGVFLELEGRPRDIDRARAALGYRPEDSILLSYGALYAARCAEKGGTPGDMLF